MQIERNSTFDHSTPSGCDAAKRATGAFETVGLAAIAAVAAGVALAEPVTVPSGQVVEFLDVVRDAEGTSETTWRFRFVAPRIARDSDDIPIDMALADIDALCKGFVLERLAEAGEAPAQIIISLSDRPVEFGASVPEATQLFEAYRIEDGACIWEGF